MCFTSFNGYTWQLQLYVFKTLSCFYFANICSGNTASETVGGDSHSLCFTHQSLLFSNGTDGSLVGKRTGVAFKGQMKVIRLDDDCSIYVSKLLSWDESAFKDSTGDHLSFALTQTWHQSHLHEKNWSWSATFCLRQTWAASTTN